MVPLRLKILLRAVRDMSKGTKEAAGTIENNMGMINDSIAGLNKTLVSFSKISTEQNDMINQVLDIIQEFKTVLSDLNNDGQA